MDEMNNGENLETEPNQEQEEKQTYTKDEVMKLLQSEADKRVTEALKKAERKKEQAVKEATRLAKMNDDERFQEELKQRESAIAEKERQLALAENKAAASEILADKGLSIKLVDFVVADDAETMDMNIRLLDEAFKASVKNEVEKRLQSTTPKKNLPTDGHITKEQFRKMTLSEQSEIFRNNPTLYESLTR